MTKRISLLFEGDRPDDAPEVMWVADALTVEDLAERVPGAVGYVDLDLRIVEVRPGALTDEEVERRAGDVLR